jgi:thioredoxin 1
MVDFLKTLFGKQEEPAQEGLALAEPASGAEPLHVTDETFEELVLNADLPAMVDFWAPWCGPCRMVAPIVEDLARDFGGRAVIAKVNTDENAQTMMDYGIMGIPTLILFKGGQEVGRVVGYAPRHTLESHLKALVEPNQ